VAHRFLVLAGFTVLLLLCSFRADAQPATYSLKFVPDAWYNDVDGIRAGLRLRGEQQGTFNDGFHRLDAGLWLGTWLPDNPLSYYIEFTEPVSAISSIGSEGNISAQSTIRTGYSKHKIGLNKRWQPGFDEFVYREFSVALSQEKLFDDEYRPYPLLWQQEWKSLAEASFVFQNNNEFNRYRFKTSIIQNFNDQFSTFTVWKGQINHHIKLKRFSLNSRIYGFLSSDDTAPEYLHTSSLNPAIGWLSSGFTRAKGTIPQPWLEAGSIQVSGGANLRGYVNRDIEALNNNLLPLFNNAGAFNIELEFPNPVNAKLKSTRIVGDLVSFRSYTFFDGGIFNRSGDTVSSPNLEDSEERFDAGLGLLLSLNIPDFLGKPRGFVVRYEIPFWLSDPEEGNNNLKFRQLLGIGAVISL